MEMEESSSVVINNSGTYLTNCVELEVTALAVNTIIEVQPLSLSLPCSVCFSQCLPAPPHPFLSVRY